MILLNKRSIEIKVRLTVDEAIKLTKLTVESGYSREAYIRSLLDGQIPQPIPPPDYYAMMKEFNSIGNNLNQVAQKAHTLNVIDVKRYDENVKLFIDALTKIEETILLPMKRR